MTAEPLPFTPAVQPAASTLDATASIVLAGYPRRYQPQSPTPRGFSQAGCHSGFSEARVWRLETASGPCALRAVAAYGTELARLRGLHRLLTHVGAGAPQVAIPIPRSDGATFCTEGGCLWQLEPWMPGVADFCQSPNPPRLHSAMTCLARWHLAAARFVPQSVEQPWFFVSPSGTSPGLSERARQIERWNGEACDAAARSLADDPWHEFREPAQKILHLFRRVAPGVARNLALGASVAVPLQPCLRDVWHDHLLFTGDEVTGLIDANACRSDSVATDLARLLGSLLADDRPQWDATLAAYERTRPLSLAERGLIELFDASSVALSGLTWLDWRYRQKREFAQPERVPPRLAAILQRLERLAARM